MFKNKRVALISYSIAALITMGLVGILGYQKLPAWLQDQKARSQPTKTAVQIETNDEFQMLIKGKLAEVQKCYISQLKQGLEKQGNLVILWAVDADGNSSQFSEETNDMNSTELFDCTVMAIKSWAFPRNRPTFIRYTFKMKGPEKSMPQREVSSTEITESQ